MGLFSGKFAVSAIKSGLGKSIAKGALANSPGFAAYCKKTATAGIVASVGFTTMMFQTDAVYDIDKQDIQRASWEQRTSVATTVETVKKAEQEAEGEGGNGGGGGGGGTNIPGVMPVMQDWYTDVPVGTRKGAVTNEVFDLGSKGTVPLYNGYPWDIVDGTYIFDTQKANTDVVNYLNATAGDTGFTHIDAEGNTVPGVPSMFSYEKESVDPTRTVGGVTCVRFAPAPCMVDRGFCDSFKCDKWWQSSTPDAAMYGYYDNLNGTVISGENCRKYCAILKRNSDGNIYYLPMVASDSKGHTFPTGVFQTHIQLKQGATSANGPFLVKYGDAGPDNQQLTWGNFVNALNTIIAEPREGLPVRRYFKVCIECIGSSNGTNQTRDYEIMGIIAWPI